MVLDAMDECADMLPFARKDKLSAVNALASNALSDITYEQKALNKI